MVDADDLFAGLLNKCYKSGRTPTLDKIDPYANIIIKGPDVQKLIAELPILEGCAQTDPEKHQVVIIGALARRCLAHIADHHLYFIGD
ncbi:hypothetical protein ACQPYA_23340 [Micromonospora sp. CA-263727]|uniref:hypothetical protein n=1 Tax=Micromonospora sp. CA-263727 TaxID=3239967 RepID=UPI003D8A2B2E